VTAPAEGRPLVDAGNRFLGEYPAEMVTGKVQGPNGERLAMTIRSGPATVTVMLSRDAAMAWAAQLEAGATTLSTLVMPAGPLPPFPLSPNGLTPNGRAR
jgi:hypothetical protein